MDFDVLRYKVSLLGDKRVGKTSLVKKFIEDKFDDNYVISLGIKTSKKEIEITHPTRNKTQKVELEINDLMGDFHFTKIMDEYIQGSAAAVIVTDHTRKDTFDNIQGWVDYSRRVVGGMPLIVAANKDDLKQEYQISDEEAKAYASKFGLPYLETSAKTGDHVEELFKLLAEECIQTGNLK